MLDVSRRKRLDETKNPEYDGEDKRGNRQQEVADHLCQGGSDAGAGISFFFLLLLLTIAGRLDLYQIHFGSKNNMRCPGTLRHLIGGVKNHLQEGNGHCEKHPDVDHFDVRSNWQALRKTQESKETLIANRICFSNLHGCKHQKDCKVDLDDHVHVVLSKEPCREADNDKEHGRHKHSQ